jgi:hypothetical protein
MAQIDFTITDAEYNKMMSVLNAMRTKLVGLKAPLTKMLASQTGKDVVKLVAATDRGRFLREVYTIHQQLNKYFDDIRWNA